MELEDILEALNKIERLGTPLRTSDKEACEESLSVLNFLKDWVSKENVILVMQDEF